MQKSSHCDLTISLSRITFGCSSLLSSLISLIAVIGKPFALVVHAHALERHERAVADVAGEVDLAVRALADLPELLVAVLDAAAAAPLLVARRGGRELDAPVERGRCGRRGRGELLLVGVLLASSFFRSRAAAGRGRRRRGR